MTILHEVVYYTYRERGYIIKEVKNEQSTGDDGKNKCDGGTAK